MDSRTSTESDHESHGPEGLDIMSNPQLNIQSTLDSSRLFIDSACCKFDGPTRSVHLYRASPAGGGSLSKSEDGTRCAVAGKESLRIMHISDGSQLHSGHKSSVGRGGYRIDASRNLWDGSSLKIDSASTDVAWGRGAFNSKILTSARNGEIIMWDINKSGASKYERKSKDHLRSINTMSVSNVVHHYGITGSADGDMRVWDMRDMARSLMRVHHPTSVRSVAFSPCTWQPLHAIVGLDNGSIYRWDLKMGQRGLLDRIPVTHTASVTTLDWSDRSSANTGGQSGIPSADGVGNSLGWLISGGLDRCVKVWDLTAPGANTRMPTRPKYTLHPSFPVRRVAWRPSYECELAVVSNVEFTSGSNPELGQNIGVVGGIVPAENDKPGAKHKMSIGGDPVEIWDVRRAWIPKWSVVGSAGEGGLSDLVFGNSDVIWTQSSSGTFAQIDLRSSIRPLDHITRTAVTWEVSGSMTFVTDSKMTGEIPYDDIPQDLRVLAEKPHVRLKAIGDPRYTPLSQDVGTVNNSFMDDEVFSRLARGYICHGEDRPSICAFNAGVALQAKKDHLAQAWLLLGASLTETVPTTHFPLFGGTKGLSGYDAQPLPNLSSAPPASTNSYPFPSDARNSSQLRKTSPSHTPAAAPRSSSTSRKITPASSNASSPRQVSNALPAVTPRRPSFFNGREMGDTDLTRRASTSFYRRPSASTQGSHSLSPADKSGSLRHVGEGALDDSDSSSPNGSDAVSDGDRESSEEDSNLQPLISPGLVPSKAAPVPSPLSQVAGRYHSTEEESEERDDDADVDESSSPSPQSTDTDSPAPVSAQRLKLPKSAPRLPKKHVSRLKSRSRSSTVASLAAATPVQFLTRRDSQSSVRTVTAGEVAPPAYEGEESGKKPKEDEHITNGRHRHVSTSELASNQSDNVDEDTPFIDPQLTDRRIEIVTMDEKRFHNLAWRALREALERFSDEGDIQMCAMLSIVAPVELGVSKCRAMRFVESYIDLLTRRRMHVCSAYLRKHCNLESIRTTTLLETTLHSMCGRCRKPLLAGKATKGGYSYCTSCRKSRVICAICRLPVRALLLQCATCSHGGHQACYKEFYSRHPPLELPGSLLRTVPASFAQASSGRKRSSSNSTDEDLSSTTSTLTSTAETSTETSSPKQGSGWSRVAGYRCPAGCGHICWATNIHEDNTLC